MTRVVMLLANAFRPDPRVALEAKSLAGANYQVTVICWDRESHYAPHERINGFQIERIQNVQTSYGAGGKQIFHTPRFWRHAASRALTLSPHVIHCHDLDTLPAGWWIKRHTNARLIYDAHEDYPALMSLYLAGPMVKALTWLERRLIDRVDCTITASTLFAEKLSAQGIAPVVTIGNYHPLSRFDKVSSDDIKEARSSLGLEADDLIIAYIGGFSRNRLLLPLIEAAEKLPDVHFLLWGDGHQRSMVEIAAAKTSNVRYPGWLPADLVPVYMKMADIIYYCLKPDYPGAKYNAPNTLSQAMAAGCPVIANNVGDLGRIVHKTGCGLLLPAVTSDQIVKAVEKLRDKTVRNRLGKLGRLSAEADYNWNAEGRKLEMVYEKLIQGK